MSQDLSPTPLVSQGTPTQAQSTGVDLKTLVIVLGAVATLLKAFAPGGEMAGKKFWGFLSCLFVILYAVHNNYPPEHIEKIGQILAMLYAPFAIGQGVADIGKGKVQAAPKALPEEAGGDDQPDPKSIHG